MQKVFFGCLFLLSFPCFSQSESDSISESKSETAVNVFTSGLFLSKGKIEFKIFNNLYTERIPFANFEKRASFFSSFIQLTFGTNRNLNFGLDAIYSSSVTGALATDSPFQTIQFKNSSVNRSHFGSDFTTNSKHELSHLGWRTRYKPFKNNHFTVQQGVYVPLTKANGVIVSADLFYETIIANKALLFADLGVYYNVNQNPFPYCKVFIGTLVAKRIAPYLMVNLPYELGAGTKLFITPKIELEFLYTYWLRIPAIVQERQPVTFNLGLRFTNFANF